MSSQTIDDLLHEISTLDMVLPEFQREYVWKRPQAQALIDSLLRRYPTGSLLIWKTDSPPAIKNQAVDAGRTGITKIILDGQQRLTTLYLLIKNQVPPYYLPTEIDHDPRSLHYDIETRRFSYPIRRELRARPTLVPVVDCFAGTVNVIEIYERMKIQDATPDLSKLNELNTNLGDLIAVRNELWPVQVVPSSADLNNAIDVFDRVNTSGTKLSEADLALAYVAGTWSHARRELKAKQEELKQAGYSFELSFFVRCLVTVVKKRADYSALRSANEEELRRGWQVVVRVLDQLLSVLRRVRISSTRDMATPNALVPGVAYVALHGGRFPTDSSIKHFLGWFLIATLSRRYSGGETNQKLMHDVSIAVENSEPWKTLLDLLEEERGRKFVSTTDIDGRDQKHPIFKVVTATARMRNAIDWFNGVPLEVGHSDHLELHVHHIFPQDYLTTNGYDLDNHAHRQQVNEIANLALLTQPSNLHIGTDAPSEYLPKVEQDFSGALALQFVPTSDPSLWELSQFQDFLAKRRKLITDAINEVLESLLEGVEDQVETSLEQLVSLGQTATNEPVATIFYSQSSLPGQRPGWYELSSHAAGFLNAEGGKILLGVNGTEIVGIEDDLAELGLRNSASFKDRITKEFRSRIGDAATNSLRVDVHNICGKEIVMIEIPAGSSPIILEDRGCGELHIRNGTMTDVLSDDESIQDYLSVRWPN